ncbi:MAG: ATP-binding protein [Actinomycetota bacterium]|nr:ATP-binding protein [Actinomycetota bacterium]
MAIVIVALVAAIAVLVASVRSLRRELQDVASRIEDTPAPQPEEPSPVAANAARELLAERESLAEAVAAFEDGVVIVDAEGRELLRNNAGERFRRARHADALVEEALHELLEPALAGERREKELQLFGPPREVLRVRAAPLRRGTTVIGAVAFVRDVSELRRVESVRRDFVANVSHELKTPIGALALLAETMAAGEDSPVNTQLADRVQHEASRLAHIVDDLLDLSLIEAQEAPTREPVPVHVVLHEAAERVRGAAGAAGIPLSVPPVATDLAVSGDRSQLVSAVTNLLDNAVKYSERGESVDVDASAADGVICISVRDHGIGIPSRDLERIFERFYRVDRARSRATGGTGLGLSIVRHVAQAHGGDVTVESIEGEGSTFRLRLPLSSSSDRNLSEAS